MGVWYRYKREMVVPLKQQKGKKTMSNKHNLSVLSIDETMELLEKLTENMSKEDRIKEYQRFVNLAEIRLKQINAKKKI